MSKPLVFGIGACAGGVAGVVITLALTGNAPSPAPHALAGSDGVGAPAPATAGEGNEPGRLPALPPHTPVDRERTPAGRMDSGVPSVEPAPAGRTEDEQAARAAMERALAQPQLRSKGTPAGRAEMWRRLAPEMGKWDADSGKAKEWFRQAMTDLTGTDARTAAAAGYALAWPATQHALSADQLNELANAFPQLLAKYNAGHTPFRPHHYHGLQLDPPIDDTDAAGWAAWILGESWGDQPEKLRALVAGVRAEQYPTVHLALLTVLKRRSNDIHRTYVTRLTREARDRRVLSAAWDPNRVAQLANRKWIPGQLDALDARLFRMDLPAPVRARGWQSITHLGIPYPERSLNLLNRAAGREADSGNRDFAAAAVKLLEGGLMDGPVVAALASKHPPAGE